MTDRPDPQNLHPHNEAQWRAYLNGADPAARAGRSLWQKLPSPPRCELCAAPFKGPFAPLLRLIGKRPFTKNPRYCDFCMSRLIKAEGGAEIAMSALFADVRGSVPLAEQLGPTRMREIVDRFYTAGVDVLCQGGAMVDRFMGDQIVGYFVPLYAPSHTRAAIETGLALLTATGNAVGKQPWIPIGVGVHTGDAFVGTVGRASGLLELTAIGESINVAARLASIAEAGELVCSEAAYAASGLTQPGERREVVLKGVSAAVPVRVLRAA
jgi:adenylate cyclase